MLLAIVLRAILCFTPGLIGTLHKASFKTPRWKFRTALRTAFSMDFFVLITFATLSYIDHMFEISARSSFMRQLQLCMPLVPEVIVKTPQGCRDFLTIVITSAVEDELSNLFLAQATFGQHDSCDEAVRYDRYRVLLLQLQHESIQSRAPVFHGLA